MCLFPSYCWCFRIPKQPAFGYINPCKQWGDLPYQLVKHFLPSTVFQWSFLVPLIGGRWYISPQLPVYTTYIPLIYHLYIAYWVIIYHRSHLSRELNETAVEYLHLDFLKPSETLICQNGATNCRRSSRRQIVVNDAFVTQATFALPTERRFVECRVCGQLGKTSHDLTGLWVFQLFPSIWSNYSDLTRPHPKWWFGKGNPLISGKPRLLNYYNLTRSMIY